MTLKIWKVETFMDNDDAQSTWDEFIVLAETFNQAVEKTTNQLKLENEKVKACRALFTVDIE